MNEDDDELLLAVLNTTPVHGGVRQDHLQGTPGLAWLVAHGGVSSTRERDSLIETRDLLQHAVREEPDGQALARFLEGVAVVPVLEGRALVWDLRLPGERELAARVVLAWAKMEGNRPHRLKACANPQCERFLLDRSHSNQARWCSMATCGNRAKARRHYERTRAED
jgi:predicted RNA-binding Zn ribbon-like protein